MRAAVLQGLDQLLELMEIPLADPSPSMALVQIKAAALNKRDYWITKGKYPGISFPLILGSDGAGLDGDREVIIDPGIGWGSKQNQFEPGFRILGMPDFGTFAQWVSVPAENIYDKPAHLTWAEAAALPVCGVTAFRALTTRGRAERGEKLLVTGIGGGVASMALLFGVALGLEVWVNSSSDHKIDLASQYGASGGINYTRERWENELIERAGRFDIVVDGAGGTDFSRLVQLMNPAGRIVSYGGTKGLIDGLSPQRIFWKQLDILGSTMGSPQNFKNMLDFVSLHQIKPVVSHLFSLEEINDAMAVIAKGEQFGKICIAVNED